MLRRIDESIERQRFLLATLDHELRSPLTILRARLEENPQSNTKTSVRNDIKPMCGWSMRDARPLTVALQGLSNVLEHAISVSGCGDSVSISMDIDGCVAVRASNVPAAGAIFLREV